MADNFDRMYLFSSLDFSLPLSNPVLKFALILLIILFAPIILNKLKIPYLIGLIIAGAIIGPYGFNLILRDSSIVLFGTVGLLYIMFLAGLEIDLGDFKKNSGKSLVFGLYTFVIPMVIGIIGGYYFLQFSMPTSILLASMFASHTLIAYPVISKFGITKNRAVSIAIGGTLITDTLALLVLAVIVGMSAGKVNNEFWISLGLSAVVFGSIIMFLFPIIGRWFFKRNSDNISQYIFILAMVFLGAFLAEAAGIEAIIGAFLAGLSLNRLIPNTSPLMNRIEFVGNALFIPFFLIGVGMLIDYTVFFSDLETIKVAVSMTVMATLAKFLAAYFTQKTFKLSLDERRVIFGLSNAQAAATLAAVLVGYNIVLNQSEIDLAALAGVVIEPTRLLNESILNGTIVMILVTCTIASFMAQKGAQGISLSEEQDVNVDEEDQRDRILIPLSNLDSTEELVNLAVTIKSKINKLGLYALNVIAEKNEDEQSDRISQKILDAAEKVASSTDNQLRKLLRYDLNTVNGISSIVKEHRITDMIMGLTQRKGISDSFLGNLTEGILKKCNCTTLIYKPVQPLSTIKRHIIVIPQFAEKELGFPFWLLRIWNISRNTGAKLVFYAHPTTVSIIRDVKAKYPIECNFIEFDQWEDLLNISGDVKKDDNLIIVMSRKDHPSYHVEMSQVPSLLNKHFTELSYIIVYPMQSGVGEFQHMDMKNPGLLETMERLDDLGKVIGNLFRRK